MTLNRYLKNWNYPPNIENSHLLDSDLCYCADSANCTYPSGIYPNLTGFDSYAYYGVINPSMTSQTQIQGLHTGCLPFESIMESTLECFYNHDCLRQLFPNFDTIQALDINLDHTYSNNRKLADLIDELFIENVSITTDFEAFYSECMPKKCIYSYNSRGNAIFLVLTILSLIGGLYVAVKTISMIIVNLYRTIGDKCTKQSRENKPKKSISIMLKEFVGKIRMKIREFNLFEHENSNEYRRRNEILSTRLYIFLMIIGGIIIVLYSSIIPYTLTYRVKSPSIDTYRQFVSKYPSLTCQCQQTITNYELFVTFSPTYHQFTTSIWAQNFVLPHFVSMKYTYIMNGFIVPIVQAVAFYAARILGDLSEEIVLETMASYYRKDYLSTYLTHEDEFISNINISINSMKTALPKTFTQLLHLLLNTIQGNQLLSSVFGNAIMFYNSSSIDEENQIKLLWINPMNASCNCGLSSDSCTISYKDYCNDTYSGVPGDICNAQLAYVFMSCYLMNQLFSVTLECFYNENCTREAYVMSSTNKKRFLKFYF